MPFINGVSAFPTWTTKGQIKKPVKLILEKLLENLSIRRIKHNDYGLWAVLSF
ncbi:hypothetical protein SAMN04488511_12311 [Pedobacter suwonensis]|uniref:Uncharacterized protein n=1 Tax=Pedobacter suwonensis TaxID=332999 RepID=A0A1I0U6B6_9SPHI|nr:hypothetical protein [Pedobacter suwonensis]SFA59642.1 hypothetical protein SAMN04488511_12311 [Pedobacter suwonensis]